MSEFAELEHLVDAVRRSGADRVAAALDDTLAWWRSPVRIGVAGFPGVGKSTVRAALGLPGEGLPGLGLPGEGGAGAVPDVVVHVAVWPLRPEVESAVATLAPASTLLVVNKVDTIDAAPHEPCAMLAADTGLAVVPMIASLAVAAQRNHIEPAELGMLRALAASRDATLTLSAELFLAAQVPVPAAVRRDLLARWPMAAIRLALPSLAANPSLDGNALRGMLRSASGVDTAATALGTRVGEVQALRTGQLLDELERIAARAAADFPVAAAEVEIFLDSPAAGRLGARRRRSFGNVGGRS